MNKNNPGSFQPSSGLSNYGSIKRNNSLKKTEKSDRPSTAPAKENKMEKSLGNQPSLKRLPSPGIKCNFNNLTVNSA